MSQLVEDWWNGGKYSGANVLIDCACSLSLFSALLQVLFCPNNKVGVCMAHLLGSVLDGLALLVCLFVQCLSG
jgi:hypothetical protein